MSLSKRPAAVASGSLEVRAFEACWRLFQAGETDLLEGGVAPRRVAREVDSVAGAVQSVFHDLYEQGLLEQRHGLDPETRTPRTSYAPVALVEDGGPANPWADLQGGQR